MSRIRKAVACMLFLLLFSLTACGVEDKTDSSVTEENDLSTENENTAENTEITGPVAEDESAVKDVDTINSAAAEESLSERKETETIVDSSIQDSSDGKKSTLDENTYQAIFSGNRNFICMDSGYKHHFTTL